MATHSQTANEPLHALERGSGRAAFGATKVSDNVVLGHGGQLFREFLAVCFMFDLLFSAQTGTFRLLTNGYCWFMGSPLANPVRVPFP